MKLLDKILLLWLFISFSLVAAAVLSVRQSATAARMAAHFEAFFGELLRLTLYCLAGLAVLVALLACGWLWTWVSVRRTEAMRARDGRFPLQRLRVAGGWVYIDPNKMISPALVVHRSAIVEVFTAPVDAYLRNAKTVQSTSNPTAPLAPAPVPSAPSPRLYLRQALESATPRAWLLGQADDGTPAVFDPQTSVHAGVVGSTGSGKTTSVGYVLVAQALRTGYHVVVLDPKGGADWSVWREHVEWHASDPELFERQVAALWREHERRRRLLLERNTNDVAVIGCRRTLVIIEEYGDLIAQLRRADRKRADDTDATLDRLMRLSRSTGIHLLMIDQYPEQWSNQVLAGCRYLVVFKLGPNQGAKVGEYRADRLPDFGRFSVRGREYNAWFAAPHLDKILAMTPPSAGPHVIDGKFMLCSQESEEGDTSGEQPMNAPINASMNASMNAAATAPGSLDDWYNWTLHEYLPRHPELLQVDERGRGVGVRALAEAMAAAARGDAAQYEAFKGVASVVAKRLRETKANPRSPHAT